MVIYQAIDKSKPTIIPGISKRVPLDKVAFVSPSHQTTASNPQGVCPNNSKVPLTPDAQLIEIYKDTTTLKEYINKKDIELSNKLENLNSKFNKLYNSTKADTQTMQSAVEQMNQTVEQIKSIDASLQSRFREVERGLDDLKSLVLAMDVQGFDGIKVTSVDENKIKQIALNISPSEKLVAADADGVYTTLNVVYDPVRSQVKLLGLRNQEISSCDIDFRPEKVEKVKDELGKTVVRFTWGGGQHMDYDINQFLDITDDGDGCLIINGLKLGLKIAQDDPLLYVDNQHRLRSKNLNEIKEFQDVSVRVGVLENRVNGGTYVDPVTGETVVVESVKDEILGKDTDELILDASGNVDVTKLTISSLKKYIDKENVFQDEEWSWNNV